MIKRQPKGWFSRGYLPHFDAPNTIQHVTMHLADSLPKAALRKMDAEMQALHWTKRDPRRLEKIEKWLKAGHGACVLRDPAIASMTQDTLWYFDGLRYRLLSWVVMPNHAHVLFEPIHGWPLNKIVASWKRHTAMEILAVYNVEKPVWHHEYFDRFVRNAQHLHNIVEYIHQNPVKAGLVKRAEEWEWSSARYYSGQMAAGW